MKNFPKILQDLSKDPDSILLITMFFIASCFWCRWTIKDMKTNPAFKRGILYFISGISFIIWIISYLNYGEKGNLDYFAYYAWIFVWPVPYAVLMTDYLDHIHIYGLLAFIHRKGFRLPLHVYDSILRILNTYMHTNFYVPNKHKFQAANSLLRAYKETKDEERLAWFKSCIIAYDIPTKYFGISKKFTKKIFSEKVKY